MSKNTSVCFFLIFFCAIVNCSAYEINPLPERSVSPTASILNIVFCPLNYSSNDAFLQDAGALMQRLSKTKPFNEFIQKIGAYSLSVSEEEAKIFFKETQGFPPLKVRQDFMDSISSRLGAGYKMVILDASGGSYCSELSSKDKTSLIILGKARYPHGLEKDFLHELGHSLGLRDENQEVHTQDYSPAGYPNCAKTKEEAQKWWGDLTGKEEYVDYINGCCGSKDYFRPTIASLMNDTRRAESFGPVNERYLMKILSEE